MLQEFPEGMSEGTKVIFPKDYAHVLRQLLHVFRGTGKGLGEDFGMRQKRAARTQSLRAGDYFFKIESATLVYGHCGYNNCDLLSGIQHI